MKKVAIGLDIGQTTIKGGVIDSTGAIIIKSEISSFRFDRPVDILTIVGDILKKLQNQAREIGLNVNGAGISSTIDVDSKNGKFRFINIDEFQSLINIPIVDKLSEILEMPVIIENDGIAAAWGEYCAGAGVGYKNIISLTIGTGIGGGVILDGKRLADSVGSASYFGHMCININGPKCPICPGNGCWESYVSGRALEKNAVKLIAEKKPLTTLSPHSSGKDIIAAAKYGDLTAIELLKEFGFYLGVGLVNLLNIFNPEVIILGGGLAMAGDLMLTSAIEIMDKRRIPFRKNVELEISKLGKYSGVVGAALLALNSSD